MACDAGWDLDTDRKCAGVECEASDKAQCCGSRAPTGSPTAVPTDSPTAAPTVARDMNGATIATRSPTSASVVTRRFVVALVASGNKSLFALALSDANWSVAMRTSDILLSVIDAHNATGWRNGHALSPQLELVEDRHVKMGTKTDFMCAEDVCALRRRIATRAAAMAANLTTSAVKISFGSVVEGVPGASVGSGTTTSIRYSKRPSVDSWRGMTPASESFATRYEGAYNALIKEEAEEMIIRQERLEWNGENNAIETVATNYGFKTQALTNLKRLAFITPKNDIVCFSVCLSGFLLKPHTGCFERR